MSTTSGLAVTCPRPGQYTLRVTGSRPIATEAAFEALCARLLADGDPDETVVLTFTGDVGIEGILAGQPEPVTSMGWEGLLVPDPTRRRLRMPAGFTLAPDISTVDREVIVRTHPRAGQYLDTPYLDAQESMLIRREGAIIGWVPIWRVTPTTSVIRFTVIHPEIHADEERRRTHLRLAVYAQAVESQCSQGRSVLSWLPDTGDPVNALKLSVGGATRLTHWKSIRVRRDLRT